MKAQVVQQDPIILRPKPLVYNQYPQVQQTIIHTHNITLQKIKTAKGNIAYQIITRDRKYIPDKEVKEFTSKLYEFIFPNRVRVDRESNRRYWSKNKDKYNALRRKQK